MYCSGKAFAKINLSLDIISKMDDGYHYIKTVMQSVGLSDEITIDCNPCSGDNKITVNTGVSYVPNDERNIAYKAAAVFYKHTGITGHSVNINIIKVIPVCAGLGGGSSDAACVLRMLDSVHGTSLGREILEKLAYDVGADVPFCIEGGTKLAKGRGEILYDLPHIPHCSIVICKPPFSCSTPELFRRVNCKSIRARPDTEGLINAIDKGDLRGIAKRMYNVFEDVMKPVGKGTRNNAAADVGAIKDVLLGCGALGALMSGSGSAVFGIFDNQGYAAGAHRELLKTYNSCFLTKPELPIPAK